MLDQIFDRNRPLNFILMFCLFLGMVYFLAEITLEKPYEQTLEVPRP